MEMMGIPAMRRRARSDHSRDAAEESTLKTRKRHCEEAIRSAQRISIIPIIALIPIMTVCPAMMPRLAEMT
jgi:hypothetical protein